MIVNASEADAGKRLDVFLQEQLPEYSRSRLQDWIKAGRVRVNGAGERPSIRLRGGEAVEVEPAALPPLKAYAEDLPLEILYEDAEVIAVDKPAGMVVHAGAGRHSGTLVNALLHHFGSLAKGGGEERPGIVHRLDRFTSGVLLVARTDAAHRSLAAQFAGRTVEKVYLALVHGRVKADQGRIEKPISRDPVRRIRMTARRGEGRAAITEYRVLERFAGFTYLEVRIRTGRTHQIRAHFASIGHPVAGDRLYGAPATTAGLAPLERTFLHAHRVRFAHPATGEPVTVVSPLAAGLAAWMKNLEPEAERGRN
ncbi:MAG: RluA family pseudouridine synthase [Bryobacteraceae bacterium]